MVTIASLDGVTMEGDLRLKCSYNYNGDFGYLISLNDGVMVIEPTPGMNLRYFAETISGCFKKGSSFYGIKAIEIALDCCSEHIVITSENSETYNIIQQLEEKRR